MWRGVMWLAGVPRRCVGRGRGGDKLHCLLRPRLGSILGPWNASRPVLQPLSLPSFAVGGQFSFFPPVQIRSNTGVVETRFAGSAMPSLGVSCEIYVKQ